MLPDHCHRRIDIGSPAALSRSTETAENLAAGVLGEADGARLGRIVRTLFSLLERRGTGGTLLLRRYGRLEGVECIALGRGTGHTDADRLPMDDGLGDSLDGGLDGGLAGLRRLSDDFDLHTQSDCGTAILARVMAARPANPADRTEGRQDRSILQGPIIQGPIIQGPIIQGPIIQGGAVMTVRPDADTCPDGWFIRADGLAALICGGNAGSPAQARRVETVVSATVSGIPAPMVIAAVRQACGPGLDASLAALRLTGTAVDYTALGNIPAAVVRGNGLASLSARWAMIGYNPHVPGCVHLEWGPGDHVVLSSEGCGRLAGLFIERQLHKVDPTLAAAVLLRDGAVSPGNHTVMVLRNVSGG